MPSALKTLPTEDAIRVHAYHLWEQDGRPHGRDVEFWERAATALNALRTVKASRAPKAAAKPAPAKRSKTASQIAAVAPTKGKAKAEA